MSVDCDCCAVAEDPKMADIGILSSLDPVALDQACLDLVYASQDPGKKDLLERIESRNGVHTVEAAARARRGKPGIRAHLFERLITGKKVRPYSYFV